MCGKNVSLWRPYCHCENWKALWVQCFFTDFIVPCCCYRFCFTIVCRLLLQDWQCSEIWLVFLVLPGKFFIFSHFSHLFYTNFLKFFMSFFPFSVSRCTLAFAFSQQLLHQLSSKENLSREYSNLAFICMYFATWYCSVDARKMVGMALLFSLLISCMWFFP